ncbi:ISNCY family transposase [Sulfolobus sp. E5-1-F]|uniref:ISNCY family transposase n=1 Tax=Sulfolobaceae TaxID=118883 RepID=UPI001294CE42|nr:MULTISPECIES: ISNCY family transposase [unclassified Sulfolobus]QGA53268.1 ISNCY family transposase [Sulfolobus sp. E5-1-F]QGA53608.1 ISNCY family transposase [Sulfolobus sp. E5-1-F]QGA68388.1 ISNCY family transposase [Sulfolobus sp. E11-6]QGA68729.1 ISNCY family transposase [Sulfolobus sp. E11-6]QGA68904.1 ISNCY family transposase [Sulfolobus sp. E11-6]
MKITSLFNRRFARVRKYLEKVKKTLGSKSLEKLLGASLIEDGSMRAKCTTAGIDYEYALRKLEEVAKVDLIEVVKELVGEHKVQLSIDDTLNEKYYAKAAWVSGHMTQFFYSRKDKTYIPAHQILVATIRDLETNEVYLIHLEIYLPQKVVNILKQEGKPVQFRTKIEIAIELIEKVRRRLNVSSIAFDSWYVNGRTLLPGVVSELKASARVTEGGRSVPVAEFPEGEFSVTYLGVPIKLIVVDNYKGCGRRYFFTTDLTMTSEEVITTWENRWDVETMIRDLKVLGLRSSSFKSVVKILGYMKLVGLVVNFLHILKYELGSHLGVKALSRYLKNVYGYFFDYKKLFRLR